MSKTTSTRVGEADGESAVVRNYIGGKWVDSTTNEWGDVLNPAHGRTIGRVPFSTEREVNAAVKAAKEAFPDWRATPPLDRTRYFFRMKELMEEDFDNLARTITREHGKTLEDARGSVRRAIENVEVATSVTSLMMGYNLEDGAARSIDEEVIRQPLGVFTAICPFNFPAMVPFWFWPMAVACGNTYVMKPSEKVPFTMQRVFALIDRAGFPPGVVNLINGARQAVDNLLDHQDIVGVSFVGSTPVAKYVYRRAAENGKRVQAQGGAKNVLVVMPDANYEKAIPNILGSCFGSAGQRCLAGSLIVAVDDAYDEVKQRLTEAAQSMKIGDGAEQGVDLGPVVSKEAKERVVGYIDVGEREGANLVLDGRKVEGDADPEGFFVGPTIFDGVTPDMKIASDEIFGPVVGVIRANDLEGALEVIRSSGFGNAATIYTESGKSAREFRYRAPVGNVGINVGVAAPMAYFPFGGQGSSFFGSHHGQGRDGVDFFTDRKVVITRWL